MKTANSAAASVALIFVFAAGFVGCWPRGPVDADGNRPEDVARRFVENARSGDLVGAASFWREGDVSNIEANRRRSFAEFCEYFRCESYVLRYEGADKGIYWVRFLGNVDGKTRAQILYLDPPSASKDHRWKLREDRWIREDARPKTSQ